MNSVQKQYLPGLDLLKFILAILIVSGHCQLFMEYPNLQQWWGHLTSIAVPIFFGISSYLFFRKVYTVPEGADARSILLHSIKRLLILFVCWYVLMIPMTYFQFFSVATLKETIFAFFFSCSLRGYWFIKALIINTVILYFCRRKIPLTVCTIVSIVVYLYCSCNYIYHFNPVVNEFHPYYSFYYHTAYFCSGALFARFQNRLQFENWRTASLLLIWLFLLVLTLWPSFDPIFRLTSFILLFPIFYKMKPYFSLSSYKHLRDMSIILYMVQFVLIWLYNGACDMWLQPDSMTYVVLQYSITRFFIVTMVSISIAWLILKYEKYPKYAFLHYLH